MDFRLSAITLDEQSVVQRSRAIEQEREVAIYDLLEANVFKPAGSPGGPYHLTLGVEETRLALDITLEDGTHARQGAVVAGAAAQDGEGLFPGLRKLLQGDPHRAALPDRGPGHGAPRPARRRRAANCRPAWRARSKPISTPRAGCSRWSACCKCGADDGAGRADRLHHECRALAHGGGPAAPSGGQARSMWNRPGSAPASWTRWRSRPWRRSGWRSPSTSRAVSRTWKTAASTW